MDLKKIIIRLKWFPFSVINKISMKLRHIEYGKRFVSYGPIFFRGTGEILLGDDVKITSCRETNPIGGDTKSILYAKGNGKIFIDSSSGLSNVSIVAAQSISIGKNVFIGGSCKLYDHDFHSINLDERLASPDLGVKMDPIVIEDGVFIGAHSIILKGVTIGKESVIGAGSVVTKSIPPKEIWGGNPARFIRKIE